MGSLLPATEPFPGSSPSPCNDTSSDNSTYRCARDASADDGLLRELHSRRNLTARETGKPSLSKAKDGEAESEKSRDPRHLPSAATAPP